MKKAKKTNKSEFSNKKISTAKRPCSGSAAVHDVESAGSKSGNTAVTNPEELLDFAVAVAVRLQSCGAVVGYVCDRYLRRNLLSALLMSLGCLIFCQGVLFLVQVFLGHVGFGAGLLPVLRQIGLSLLAAPPVYLAAWLIRKAGA